MKITHNELKLMLMRPAVYNGEEFEIDVQLENASLRRTDLAEADAIGMKPGDTASIRGEAFFGDAAERVTVYMSEDILTEFVERYGLESVTDAVTMRVKLTYATNEYYGCPDEIIACKLLEIRSPAERG